MTRDDIIRMAREAAKATNTIVPPESDAVFVTPFIERFAALVAAAEREACARLCEDFPLPQDPTQFTHIPTIVGCAAAIRARGESK